MQIINYRYLLHIAVNRFCNLNLGFTLSLRLLYYQNIDINRRASEAEIDILLKELSYMGFVKCFQTG